MIPRPKSTEGKQFASKAINLLKDEGISRQEAIETVCSLALVPNDSQTPDDRKTFRHIRVYPKTQSHT